jgi:hypothetical protein
VSVEPQEARSKAEAKAAKNKLRFMGLNLRFKNTDCRFKDLINQTQKR